ncbi:hypothetical protein ACFYPT_28550 [Streptomyces sp. NPDC005529]
MIYADPDGDARLAVDRPGLLFDSYGNPQPPLARARAPTMVHSWVMPY